MALKILNKTPKEITTFVKKAQESDLSSLKRFISATTHKKQLETIGNALNKKGFIFLLQHYFPQIKKHHWKLSSILVGLSPSIFFSLISHFSPTYLKVLQEEIVQEPLQHLLTLFVHEMNNRAEFIYQLCKEVEEAIEKLSIKEPSKQELRIVKENIMRAKRYAEILLNQLNNALLLSWNTKRLDLIETLSVLKENICILKEGTIGSLQNAQQESSGLFLKIQEKLLSIYGDPNDTKNIKNLKDSEPSLEALSLFSLWYLSDYWDLGLLPQIKNRILLDPSHLENLPSLKRQAYIHNIYLLVQDNLEKLGLKTVKDLKKHLIYSKETLVSYIEEHQHLIKENGKIPSL